MKKVNIGLLGGSFCCPNFGVGALSISQCNILDSLADELNIKINVICYEAMIQNDYIQKFKNLKVTLDTHTLNIGIMKKKLARHDLIIDMYGGDSFADIYSVKGFIIGCSQRLLSMNKSVAYLMAPQTIGPFNNRISRMFAKRLMTRAEHIFCRDCLSMKLIPDSLKKKTTSVTDMAFRLPYCVQPKNEKIGLNVSGLLWNSSLLGGGEQQAYQSSIRRIIDYCIERNFRLVLVPHVNDLVNSLDGDYEISRKLMNEYEGKIELAPQFTNPVEAKTFISQFKLFIGSRMHATIASTSMGIPTLAIAYSKKFQGLFQALNYPYVIEKNNIDKTIVCSKLDEMLNNYEYVTEQVNYANQTALNALKLYDSYLKDFIEGIIHE